MFKRNDILLSEYPESFVGIEIMTRKEIKIYGSVWVRNPYPK